MTATFSEGPKRRPEAFHDRHVQNGKYQQPVVDVGLHVLEVREREACIRVDDGLHRSGKGPEIGNLVPGPLPREEHHDADEIGDRAQLQRKVQLHVELVGRRSSTGAS